MAGKQEAATGSKKSYYTLDRDPTTDEWDTCPVCETTLRYRGDDETRDDYDRYAMFICATADCRVREVVVRNR